MTWECVISLDVDWNLRVHLIRHTTSLFWSLWILFVPCICLANAGCSQFFSLIFLYSYWESAYIHSIFSHEMIGLSNLLKFLQTLQYAHIIWYNVINVWFYFVTHFKKTTSMNISLYTLDGGKSCKENASRWYCDEFWPGRRHSLEMLWFWEIASTVKIYPTCVLCYLW